jgi:hypothetical protein
MWDELCQLRPDSINDAMLAASERDELKARVAELEAHVNDLSRQRGAFIVRIADLESQLESVACRAADAEMELDVASGEQPNQTLADGGRPREEPAESATADSSPSLSLNKSGVPADGADPTASGGGEREPVAWGFTYANGSTDGRFYNSRASAEEAVPNNGTVVPLYAAPPQPRGWIRQVPVGCPRTDRA